MRLAEIFIPFCNKINKFNNKEARLLDFIYHNSTLKSRCLPCKDQDFILYKQSCYDSHCITLLNMQTNRDT